MYADFRHNIHSWYDIGHHDISMSDRKTMGIEMRKSSCWPQKAPNNLASNNKTPQKTLHSHRAIVRISVDVNVGINIFDDVIILLKLLQIYISNILVTTK